MKQFFLKEKAGASNKKKKKNTQSDQTEKVYSMSMVVNSEQKEENLGNQAEPVHLESVVANMERKKEKAKGESFIWKPKHKKDEKPPIPFNSKLNNCVHAFEIACKNMVKMCVEFKEPGSAMHYGINP